MASIYSENRTLVRRRKSAVKTAFAALVLASLVMIASISGDYVEFWKAVAGINLSVSQIGVSSIPIGTIEVNNVTVSVSFNLTNPSGYGGLKVQSLYYHIYLNDDWIGRETVFLNTPLEKHSYLVLTGRIELMNVSGDKLSSLANAEHLRWQITCLLVLEGLMGETRRTYYLIYPA